METWWKPWLVTDTFQIRLFLFHVQDLDKWEYRGLCNGYWRLYRNDRAGASLRVGSEIVALEPGRLYLVPAGVRFDCACEAPLRHLYVHFEVLGMPHSVTRSLFDRIYCYDGGPEAEDEIADVLREWTEKEFASLGMRCRIKSVLYKLLAAWISSFPDAQIRSYEQGVASIVSVQPAIDYIERHLADSIGNEVLAQICGLSQSHFIRLFRLAVSQTPSDYVQEKRIMRASNLLLFTRHGIDRIADECGFRDRNYFTRVFTRRMGVAPATYRRQAG